MYVSIFRVLLAHAQMREQISYHAYRQLEALRRGELSHAAQAFSVRVRAWGGTQDMQLFPCGEFAAPIWIETPRDPSFGSEQCSGLSGG